MSDNLLVSTQWLHDHLTDPAVRIVDIRGHVAPASDPLPHYFNHHADYVQSHIPNAVFVDWVQQITDPADPRHAQIAKPERFATVMSELGIGDDTHVIAYDDAGGMFAARLWWALTYYGHEKVSVLDGGWQRWTAENRPVTSEVPVYPNAHFTPRPNANIYRNSQAVLAGIGHAQTLIDVRTPEEFNGAASRASRRGHIPSAINLPRGTLTRADGLLPSAEELRAKFAAAGINDESENVVFYCNGGVSASYGLLTYRLAGFEGGAVYDGSWKDWGNDDSKPIE